MTYMQGVLQAYEGELIGERLYGALAAARPEPAAQQRFALIAAVERATNMLLQPIAARLGLKASDERVSAAVARRTPEIASLSWPEFVRKAMHDWPPYVPRFEALRELAPPDDAAVLEMVVEHERALVEFIRREAVEHAAALEPLQQYLARASALAITRQDPGPDAP
jgi:hypothetical protein